MTAPRFKISTARLCKGWREFSDANNLEVGDVCIFKLLNGTEISFEVSIVRFAEYAFLEWSQAGDYATGTSKQKGDVRVIEID
ncbi:B3 DNA binding domain containing protein [Trema orientale]|uniref:B3 DNA binding domain containing protein n=1 Tax=Trema orientale TaxID=63057 RepID=A0A2P5DZJ1_TREOI|nr:B3 DNA binding domain containing protein [Trema orientale]